MTDKLREAAQQALEALKETSVECAIEILEAALAQQDAQAAPLDMRYTPGHVLVPNQIAWGIVGSSGHARKRAVDALRDLLYAAPTPPAQQPLTVQQYTEIAHRTASRYAHRSDPKQVCYTFFPHTLEDFVRKLEAVHNIGTTK